MTKSIELKAKDDLKDYLRTCNTSRSGQFGEKLFSYLIEEMGLGITSVHKEGADFFVEGVGRVDVKAKVRLNELHGSGYPRISKRLPSTSYCYVLFWRDIIEVQLCDEINPSNNFNRLVSWDKALECWVAKVGHKKQVQTDNSKKVKATKDELRTWIKSNWGLKGGIIYRQGREAQDNMSKSGWGPESFHEKPETKIPSVLKVLL